MAHTSDNTIHLLVRTNINFIFYHFFLSLSLLVLIFFHFIVCAIISKTLHCAPYTYEFCVILSCHLLFRLSRYLSQIIKSVNFANKFWPKTKIIIDINTLVHARILRHGCHSHYDPTYMIWHIFKYMTNSVYAILSLSNKFNSVVSHRHKGDYEYKNVQAT